MKLVISMIVAVSLVVVTGCALVAGHASAFQKARADISAKLVIVEQKLAQAQDAEALVVKLTGTSVIRAEQDAAFKADVSKAFGLVRDVALALDKGVVPPQLAELDTYLQDVLARYSALKLSADQDARTIAAAVADAKAAVDQAVGK
jgi:hypothetical protein